VVSFLCGFTYKNNLRGSVFLKQNYKENNKLLLAIFATGIMTFCGVLIETAMNVTFPSLMNEFNISLSMVQWVTTIYLLIISIIVPISSYFNQKFDKKKLFITSNLIFIAGVIIDCVSPTFFILLIGRLLQGLATGIALPLMFNIILEEAPQEKRGTMMGFGVLTTAIAPAIGPTFGGWLTTELSWRYIFISLIPILILSLFLGIYSISSKKEKNTSDTKFDFLAVFYITLIFGGLLFFFTVVGEKGVFSWLPWTYFIVGIFGLLLFIRRMKISETPLINLEVFKHVGFDLLLISFLVYQFLLLGLSFIIPNYLQIVQLKSASISGMFMLPGALIGAILAPISGRILDKLGPKKPILLGLILSLIALTLMAFLIHSNILVFIIICHSLFMIGEGIAYSNLMTTALNQLPTSFESDGNAIFNTLQQFSGAVATSIVAAIIASFQKNSASGDYILGTQVGVQAGLIFLLILIAIGLFSTMRFFTKQRSLKTNIDKCDYCKDEVIERIN